MEVWAEGRGGHTRGATVWRRGRARGEGEVGGHSGLVGGHSGRLVVPPGSQ